MGAGASPAPWPGPGARRGTGSWLPFGVAATAALLATLAVPVLPPLQFAYPAPSLHVAVETGAALTGLLATAILVGSWYDGPRLDRLAIAAGLSLLAVTGAVMTALLAISPGSGERGMIGLTGMLVGSALLAAGALTPARRPASPRSAAAAMVLLTGAAIGATLAPVAIVLAQWPDMPAGIDMARPMLDQPPAAVLLQLAIVAGLAIAAVGLTRRGVRTGDAFAGRVGAAIVFCAFAMVHYMVFPPVAHDWVHAGDVLRLLSCAVLLWAALGEIATVAAARAAARERRRIARDLHDGVAQELAFIRRRAARLAGADEIAVAAERALLDSREAIERLAQPPDEPLERALARHAAAVGSRTGVAVDFESSGAATAGPEVSEALTRILGEAVANARHGDATRVWVELSADPLRLRVADDGTGFDPDGSPAGFGLGGMRERAALVGAELSVRSGPGAGTEVAVELR